MDKQIKTKQELFTSWLLSSPGRRLRKAQCALLESWLQGCYGYHICQLGLTEFDDWLAHCRIGHQIGLELRLSEVTKYFSPLVAQHKALPFADESVDCVFMPHTLELTEHLEATIDEAWRILIPNGKLIVLGLNPHGWWQVARFLTLGRYPSPLKGRALSKNCCYRELNLLRFTPMKSAYISVWPELPFARFPSLREKAESLCQQCFPSLGMGFALLLEKRASTLTPIRPTWAVGPARVREIGVSETMRYDDE